MKKYFGDTYHGGIMYMHLWGEYAHHQPPFWDWAKSVPRWLLEHAFRRLDSIAGYKVNLEMDSSTLEYLQEYNPQLLSLLKKQITKGHLEIVDGTYAQPYSLLQSGESCIRHFYYGQKTIKDILGTNVKTYCKQEPFFFPQLPQILTKTGYKHTVLRVHITHYGECPLIKKERVLWVSPDGSVMDTVPNYLDTDNRYSMTTTIERLRKYENACTKIGFKSILVTTGLDMVHDIDYLPTFKSDFVEKLVSQGTEDFRGEWAGQGVSDDRIREIQRDGYAFVTLSEYFETEKPGNALLELEADDFKFRYKCGQLGDLLLRRNKEVERAVYDAETFASFIRMSNGPTVLSENSQREIWKFLLCSQNHDFHACPTSYSYGVAASPCNTSLEFTTTSRNKAEKIIDESLDCLVANINTAGKGNGSNEAIALAVFNQLLGERISIVNTTVICPRGFAKTLCLADKNKEVPTDISVFQHYEDGSIFKAVITFNAELPSMGYRVYYLRPAGKKPHLHPTAKTVSNCLESNDLKITFGKDGLIESAHEKRSDFEYLDTRHFKGNELTVDFGDGLLTTRNNDAEIKTVCGRISSTVAVNSKIGNLKCRMLYRLYHELPRLDCETTIDFDTALRTKSMDDEFSKFRVTFNPSFEGSLFTDQPFSVYPSTKKRALGYNFGCYTNHQHGITLVNNGNIGYFRDMKRNTKMSLILAFGDDSYYYGPLLLSGIHTFKYSLFFHNGNWKSGHSIKKSMEISRPPYARQTCLHTGTLPAEHSFISIPRDSIAVSACYPAESGICLRIWETDREKTKTRIKLGFDTKKIEETDLLGKPISRCDSRSIRFAPWEIKTLYINL